MFCLVHFSQNGAQSLNHQCLSPTTACAASQPHRVSGSVSLPGQDDCLICSEGLRYINLYQDHHVEFNECGVGSQTATCRGSHYTPLPQCSAVLDGSYQRLLLSLLLAK